MQIVDEADETETINRPSFFDAMQMQFSQQPAPANKFKSAAQSPLGVAAAHGGRNVKFQTVTNLAGNTKTSSIDDSPTIRKQDNNSSPSNMNAKLKLKAMK